MDRSQNRTFRAKTARSKHEIVRGLNLLRPKNSLTKLKKKVRPDYPGLSTLFRFLL